jgi:hypothetical protein
MRKTGVDYWSCALKTKGGDVFEFWACRFDGDFVHLIGEGGTTEIAEAEGPVGRRRRGFPGHVAGLGRRKVTLARREVVPHPE